MIMLLKRVHVFGIGMLLTSIGMCRAQQQPPFELIEQLTEPTLAREMGLFSCGVFVAEHRAASALAGYREEALPGIEAELDAIEKSGNEGFGAYWLELAYARIKGRAAYTRLRRLENDPRFGADREFVEDSSRRSLDRSIALALGLTSFVSAPKNAIINYHACKYDEIGGSFISLGDCPAGTHPEPLTEIHCDRRMEPQDGLTRLIRAFERNDEFLFQAGLGPDAKSALTSLLNSTTWNEYRRMLLHGDSSGDLAVGYQFEEAGRWSEPEETLEEERPAAPIDENPVLRTQFTNGSGGSCGHFQVKFELDRSKQGIRHLMPYLVNNSDLEGLLQVMASCAISR
jgi:hypothetical protein